MGRLYQFCACLKKDHSGTHFGVLALQYNLGGKYYIRALFARNLSNIIERKDKSERKFQGPKQLTINDLGGRKNREWIHFFRGDAI